MAPEEHMKSWIERIGHIISAKMARVFIGEPTLTSNPGEVEKYLKMVDWLYRFRCLSFSDAAELYNKFQLPPKRAGMFPQR